MVGKMGSTQIVFTAEKKQLFGVAGSASMHKGLMRGDNHLITRIIPIVKLFLPSYLMIIT